MSRAKKRRINSMRRKQRRGIEVLAAALMFSPFAQGLIASFAFRRTQRFLEQQAAHEQQQGGEL